MCCPDCRQPYPSSSTACTEKRYLIDGIRFEPIPWGAEAQTQTYRERIDEYRAELRSGGRGRLSRADVRQELDAFLADVDPEDYNSRDCPACGVEQGEFHHHLCDYEECPACGGQPLLCPCDIEVDVIEDCQAPDRTGLLAGLLTWRWGL